MNGARVTFDYHRGVAPMLWVVFALSLIELIAVHLFVTLTWPWIGWPLTILSLIISVWMVIWIRSFPKLPHVLGADGLLLRLGRLKSVRVELSEIARVIRGWEDGATTAKNGINLAGIAYPNRCIELVSPIEKGKMRVFIRLDDPGAFDAALGDAGIAIE
ncbi:MAG: hypothetical protein AAF687_13700 [Pseudomonadota bacterium]